MAKIILEKNQVGGLGFKTPYKKWDYVGREGVCRRRGAQEMEGERER